MVFPLLGITDTPPFSALLTPPLVQEQLSQSVSRVTAQRVVVAGPRPKQESLPPASPWGPQHPRTPKSPECSRPRPDLHPPRGMEPPQPEPTKEKPRGHTEGIRSLRVHYATSLLRKAVCKLSFMLLIPLSMTFFLNGM